MKKAIDLIRQDLTRYVGNPSWRSFFRNILFNRSFKYGFWFRLCSCDFWPIEFLAKIRLKFLTNSSGIEIPPGTRIGGGLYIGHSQSLVVSSTCVIGRNCNLSQFTTIGANNGVAANIGDNVYIGPGVCIVENVVIGDNVTVGAGSVVTRDIPTNSTAAGVPARVINFDNPGRYIKNRAT